MANSKNPKKRWIRIRIDFETGAVVVNKNDIKGHDQGSSENQLNQQEIDQLLAGEYTDIGRLVFTHQSPGCVTYIFRGDAVKICY